MNNYQSNKDNYRDLHCKDAEGCEPLRNYEIIYSESLGLYLPSCLGCCSI